MSLLSFGDFPLCNYFTPNLTPNKRNTLKEIHTDKMMNR